jgi:hypothetical protein
VQVDAPPVFSSSASRSRGVEVLFDLGVVVVFSYPMAWPAFQAVWVSCLVAWVAGDGDRERQVPALLEVRSWNSLAILLCYVF